MKTWHTDFKLNPKQRLFVEMEGIDEVCYGGAAGGGKTYIQCGDAYIYAMKYEGSKQLILRRTFPELERNIVRQSLEIFPQKPFAKYNATKHLWEFYNGSIIEFGYMARERDVYLYQGAEFDIVRIDECTHLPYSSVDYLRSRIRGTAPFPRSLKLTTNPGNIGHAWVKQRYVSPVPPNHIFTGGDGTRRLYIPASVYDNKALMESDPAYVRRLEAMQDDVQREMLLHGNWDVAAGAFFNEFTQRDHVREPFDFSKYEDVKLYRSIDYGLDMLACLWYAVLPPSAVNPYGSVLVYRELCEEDLTISEAARKIREATPPNEHIICTYAPTDVMNNRDRLTGRNQADIFASNGLGDLVKANNDRKAGLLAIKELIKKRERAPILKIFSTCRNLIKNLPMAVHDEKNYGDISKEPHEITHVIDSLRYFAIHQWNTGKKFVEEVESNEKYVEYGDEMLKDYRRASPDERLVIEKMMGGKPKLDYYYY